MHIFPHAIMSGSRGAVKAFLVGDMRADGLLFMIAYNERCTIILCVRDDFTQADFVFVLLFFLIVVITIYS